jgi:peptidoglycan/LPS O-acetylase OafA/YrhL
MVCGFVLPDENAIIAVGTEQIPRTQNCMPTLNMPDFHGFKFGAGIWQKARNFAKAQPSPVIIQQELGTVLKSKVISGLDAFRAMAITLVLIDHFDLLDRIWPVHLYTGSLGVMLFFVLSGFLITSMLLREHRKTGSISLRNFYRRRAYRIFPTFYTCWILTTVVESLAHRYRWKTSVVSFFYMMDYGRALYPVSARPYLHLWISWSLAIEEKFYLLWPLLLLLLLRKRTTLIRTMCLIILGLWIYRAILFLGFHVGWEYLYSAFEMRVDSLLVGCLCAILVEQEKTRGLFSRLLRWQWLAAIPAAALALIIIFPARNQAVMLLLWSIQPLIIAVWLVQFTYWGAKSWTICSNVVVRFIAHISYALYLYHPLASQIVYQLHIPHLGWSAFALMMVMSTASYYFIEKPFMRMRDKKKNAQPSPPAPAALAASS